MHPAYDQYLLRTSTELCTGTVYFPCHGSVSPRTASVRAWTKWTANGACPLGPALMAEPADCPFRERARRGNRRKRLPHRLCSVESVRWRLRASGQVPARPRQLRRKGRLCSARRAVSIMGSRRSCTFWSARLNSANWRRTSTLLPTEPGDWYFSEAKPASVSPFWYERSVIASEAERASSAGPVTRSPRQRRSGRFWRSQTHSTLRLLTCSRPVPRGSGFSKRRVLG